MLPKDFDDSQDLSYADVFFDKDTRIKAVQSLIDLITQQDSVSLLYDMLSMSTGDLTDGKLGGLFFGPSNRDITKGYLKKQAKDNNLIVVKTTNYKQIDSIVHYIRLGVFYDGVSYNTSVLKSDLTSKLMAMIQSGDINLNDLYEKDILR